MGRYIPEALRKLVVARAHNSCEYCRSPQQYAGFTFEIDHIVPLKHGGETKENNLALSCPICNGNKGSDLGTLLPESSGEVIRFFNPRMHFWDDHFYMQHGSIIGKTPEGRATVLIFGMNTDQDCLYRSMLVSASLMKP